MRTIWIILTGLLATTAHAEGIITYDPTNVVQTTISAQQAVKQTAQQLQQYQTQLQQLQNQLQNTVNPESFVWEDANATINQILATQDTIERYKAQAGSMDAYLQQFSDTQHYQTSSCIGTGGCTSTQLGQLESNQTMGSDAQKTANDAMFKHLDAQQAQLRSDATTLASLQQNAQSSTGQMQALQAANQLASHQAAQLMQLRGLLMAQQTAEATRTQMLIDKEAKEQAAHRAFIGTKPPSSKPYSVMGYTQNP